MSRVIETARLRLRPFTPDDGAEHRALYADPEVTRWLGGGPFVGAAGAERSARAVARFVDHWARYGFGVWAVLDKASGAFLGQCGLNTLDETGEVEVLYALARRCWGHGLAAEAAREALRYGFAAVRLPRIIAIAFPANTASRRVMEKIGMRYVGRGRYVGIEAVVYEALKEEGGPDSIEKESERGCGGS